MVKQLFWSIKGEQRVQILELLHRPNPMLGKPNLTPKAKVDQRGRSCPLSSELPHSRAFSSQIWPLPTSHFLLGSHRKRGTGQRQGTEVRLCSCSGQKATLRCSSLLFTPCQCLTLAFLQRSLFEI